MKMKLFLYIKKESNNSHPVRWLATEITETINRSHFIKFFFLLLTCQSLRFDDRFILFIDFNFQQKKILREI